MNIVMLGYRGTGKSVIAKIISDELGRKLYRVDDLIVQAAGKPIPEIVKQQGWSGFRKLECEVVSRVTGEAQDSVIDCGGGVVLDDNNMTLLKREGRCVLLTASLSAIIRRIKKDRNRPGLKEGLSFEEEQKQILADRHEKYQSSADFICDTTSQRPGETAHEIIAFFKKQGWVK
ncbi:MAG: shikimate kinase [Nitrospinae bacterium]|nr:shikimate kinase [Nitrospinota bacterium]MBL7020937.1 shikimate kinase [Nitrospinaceae bacterium]